MHKSLTDHRLSFIRVVVLFVISLSAYIYFRTRPGHEDAVSGLEIILMCAFLFGSLLFFISIISLLTVWLQKRKIDFGDFNIYLIRNIGESVISLKNIPELSMTGVWIKEFIRWRGYRITFIDNSSGTVYINFWYIHGR